MNRLRHGCVGHFTVLRTHVGDSFVSVAEPHTRCGLAQLVVAQSLRCVRPWATVRPPQCGGASTTMSRRPPCSGVGYCRQTVTGTSCRMFRTQQYASPGCPQRATGCHYLHKAVGARRAAHQASSLRCMPPVSARRRSQVERCAPIGWSAVMLLGGEFVSDPRPYRCLTTRRGTAERP